MRQNIDNIVKCPLQKFDGRLRTLHVANSDAAAVDWLQKTGRGY